MNSVIKLIILLVPISFAGEICGQMPSLRDVPTLDSAVCVLTRVYSHNKIYRLMLDEKTRAQLREGQAAAIDSCIGLANNGIQQNRLDGVDTLRFEIQRDTSGFLTDNPCDLYLINLPRFCRLGKDMSFNLEDCSVLSIRKAK